MSKARILIYVAAAVVNAAALIMWIWTAKKRHLHERPTAADGAIGFVTNFLDTLGIGSYAQITALFKLRGKPADELIPGTMNVGSTIPTFLSTLWFVSTVMIDPVLLACMVASAGAGAWLGAGIVSRMPRRSIQLFMGTALLIAACFFIRANLGMSAPTGTAMDLNGWRFVVAVAVNFALGALMCVGIGNYAPSMVLLALLGMHPIAAYPVMMASDGVLIPVASMGFVRSGRFAHGPAIGLIAGGAIGTICAFPLVDAISSHLSLMRWFVTVVIIYAAVSMLRSAYKESGNG